MERKKVYQHIGDLEGRLLVFGGVYSNLQALNKMKEIADELAISPSHVICTGDVVGYCAQPEECVQQVIGWGIHTIAGNVELQLRDGQDDCGCDFTAGGRCDTFSRRWYPYAKDALSGQSIKWMKSLPDFIEFNYAGLKALVIHGSVQETAGYIFKSSPWEVKRKNFEESGSDLVLAGHCGLPFSERNQNKYWLNAGVIGMPANDGTSSVWYMILDTNADGVLTFEHHNFQYDNTKAAALMQMKNLPPEYALTLKTGIWDNTEILPEYETKATGKRLI